MILQPSSYLRENVDCLRLLSLRRRKLPDFAVQNSKRRPNSRLVRFFYFFFLTSLPSFDDLDMLRQTLPLATRSVRSKVLTSSFQLPHLKPSSFTRSESTLIAHQGAEEGSIASVFSSLGGDAFVPLESRFSDLKKSLWNDGLIESWRDVLEALQTRTEEMKELGGAVSFFSTSFHPFRN